MTKLTCFVLGVLVTAAVTAAAHEGLTAPTKEGPSADLKVLAGEVAAMSSRVSILEARVKELETPRLRSTQP